MRPVGASGLRPLWEATKERINFKFVIRPILREVECSAKAPSGMLEKYAGRVELCVTTPLPSNSHHSSTDPPSEASAAHHWTWLDGPATRKVGKGLRRKCPPYPRPNSALFWEGPSYGPETPVRMQQVRDQRSSVWPDGRSEAVGLFFSLPLSIIYHRVP
jgi:hypothetical protein